MSTSWANPVLRPQSTAPRLTEKVAVSSQQKGTQSEKTSSDSCHLLISEKRKSIPSSTNQVSMVSIPYVAPKAINTHSPISVSATRVTSLIRKNFLKCQGRNMTWKFNQLRSKAESWGNLNMGSIIRFQSMRRSCTVAWKITIMDGKRTLVLVSIWISGSYQAVLL